MSAQARSGALTAGVILVVIGLILMLENWYGAFSFWRIFARYWPLLLILIGLRKLFRYFTWQEPAIPPLPVDIQPKE